MNVKQLLNCFVSTSKEQSTVKAKIWIRIGVMSLLIMGVVFGITKTHSEEMITKAKCIKVGQCDGYVDNCVLVQPWWWSTPTAGGTCYFCEAFTVTSFCLITDKNEGCVTEVVPLANQIAPCGNKVSAFCAYNAVNGTLVCQKDPVDTDDGVCRLRPCDRTDVLGNPPPEL